jgi:hypothetical protein
LFFFFKHDTDENKVTDDKVKTVSKPENKNYDSVLEVKIRNNLEMNNRGVVFDSYKFSSQTYLVLNQLNTHAYNENYRGDGLLWVNTDGKKVSSEYLGTKNLVQLYLLNNSPFFTLKDHTFFIFHERNNGSKNGKNLNGYIYEIKNNKPTLAYKSVGSFDSVTTDKNGRFILLERRYTDTVNRYPTNAKPYDLFGTYFTGSQWSSEKIKHVEGNTKFQN